MLWLQDMVIYKKKEKNVTDDDPDEYGDVYTLTAMESDTKLLSVIMKVEEVQMMLQSCLMI